MGAGEARATEVLEVLPGPVLAVSSDGCIALANRAVCSMLGREASDLVGKPLSAIVPPRMAMRDDLPLHRWFSECARGSARMTLLRQNGVEIDVDCECSIASSDSLLVMLLSNVHDDAEAQRKHASSRLIFEHAPLGLFHFDARGVLTECNENFVGIIGSPRSVLVGLNMLTLPDERMVQSLRTVLAGHLSSYEGDYRSATSNKVTPVNVLFAPVIEDGEITGGVGIVQDVTEAKAMRDRLARADRLASLGTLAAGVAHEINNPLTYIMASLQATLRRLRRDDTIARDRLEGALSTALEGAERVRRIVADLRMFSRIDERPRAPVDIHAVLDASINLCWAEIKHRARLIKEYGRAPAAWGDEVRLGQVFVNVLINAAHAIPPDRTGDGWIRLRTGTAANGDVGIEIADNGAGIAPDLLNKAFEPFVTTKPVGVGTGLGLSICHGIISSLGGDIAIDSVPGQGTAVRITLPAARDAAVPSDKPKQPPEQAQPSRILIIDDDPGVARAMEDQLGELHDAMSVTSGQDGLRLLLDDGGFDLILCDVMMPETGGLDVYDQIQRVRPDLAERFVFMTGGVLSSAIHQRLLATGLPHLDKPFSAERVDELLAARPR